MLVGSPDAAAFVGRVRMGVAAKIPLAHSTHHRSPSTVFIRFSPKDAA